MALYTSAQYRAGHQGYVAWKAQTAQLVYPHTITDPSLQSGLTNVFGPCSLPSEDITENVTEVRGVGSSMALGHVPGRREINLALHEYGMQLQGHDGVRIEGDARAHDDGWWQDAFLYGRAFTIAGGTNGDDLRIQSKEDRTLP